MASKSKRRASKRAQVRAAPPRAVPRHPRVGPKPRPPESRLARLGLAGSARRLYAWALAIGALLGVVLIGLSQISVHAGGSSEAAPPSTAGVIGAEATRALLAGIPQRGNVLGSPNAPVRLVEYADPQCPFCAVYARDVLPTIVQDYVRPGKVQLVFRGLWFLGPDSGTALTTATAAGSQNRMWNVLELLYRNQGPENAWVNDDLLRSIVAASGASTDRVFAERDSAEVAATIDGWGRLAQDAGVNAVPSFFVGRRGGQLTPVTVTALEPREFRAALDQALRS